MNGQVQTLSILCPTCCFNRGEVKALHSVKVRGNAGKTTIMILFNCKKSPAPVSGKEECGLYKFISITGRKVQLSQSGISKPRVFVKE
jgi:hypothetical protein